MYLVKALRLFVGTNAERTGAGLGAFLPGDEYHETDTKDTYQHDGMAWIQKNTATPPAGTDGQLQYNNGGAFGGSDVYWDAGNSRLGILTNAPGSTFDIQAAGIVANFGNGAGNAQIGINGAAGSVRDMFFYSNNSLRWIFRVDGTAESGSNAGSNFVINARDDSGGNLSSPLTIVRSTGATIFGGPVRLQSLTTTQQNALTAVNGMLIFNSSTGKFRGYTGGAWVDLH